MPGLYSQPIEKSLSAKASAKPVICFRRNTSSGSIPSSIPIGDKLAHAYGAEYNTAKDRFHVGPCKEYIKQQKQ